MAAMTLRIPDYIQQWLDSLARKLTKQGVPKMYILNNFYHDVYYNL